jgi:PPOX class probable F420-dependent enzyme
MRRGLTVDELGDLLALPLLAVLATYRRDGAALLSPVWHEWRDGGFDVVTDSRGIKATHLRRDPRASIVVCEHAPPYRGVELRCSARLLTAGVAAAVERIASRYLGREAGAAYASKAADDLLIRLQPGDLRAWDFADERS